MSKVLIAYASRHGGTRGIAERIGETLRSEGLEALVEPADAAPDVAAVDAAVIGSGVYMGSWLKEGTEFLARHAATLATKPVWLFSSGPLVGSTVAGKAKDPIEDALGPAEGPGSGGRKRIEELATAIHARQNRVFYGAFDPTDPPKNMAERLIRLMPASKGILPPGDGRDWPAIEAWAREIAEGLRTPVG